MDSRKIIILVIFLFALTSGYLFYVDGRDSDPNYQKNWWIIYFDSPKDGSLNFMIENHSSKNAFHWEVSDGKNKLDAGDIEIEKGATWTSDVQINNISEQKITITVSDGTETKEIYKNL